MVKIIMRLVILLMVLIFGMGVVGCDDRVIYDKDENDDGNTGITNEVTFNALTANGSSLETTTQITLSFDKTITGFSASDITLSGVYGVVKGSLSNYETSYTLNISGFITEGTLKVDVAKSGYIINGASKTVTIYNGGIDVILKKQKTTINRELVDVGFNKHELVFTHKIGEINDSFVGFLTTMDMYYTGVSEAAIKFSSSRSVTIAEEQSVTIIKHNTTTNNFSINASVEKVIKNLNLELGYTLSLASTQGTETTYGKSIATQISETSDYTYTLYPEMGAGRYAIVGTIDYTIYQVTRFNLNTNRIIGEPEIFFASSKKNPRMVLYLVKGDDESLSLPYVTNKIEPSISLISNITQWEVEKALLFAREKTQNVYEIKWGNNFDQGGLFASTEWHTYDKLDTFLEPGGGIIRSIPIDLLKAYGFNTFSVKMNYSWHSDNKNNIDMQFKFVNKTTGEQFGETPNTTGLFLFGGTNYKFDISKLRNGETIVIDIRHRKKNGWDFILPLLYGITIYSGRTYTVTFEK